VLVKYPMRCARPVRQYDAGYHLSRLVKCGKCQREVLKDREFILAGYVCSSCRQVDESFVKGGGAYGGNWS
jgi:hypothetical protein